MVSESVSEKMRATLLDPSIMVAPLLWLVSAEADGVTGRRLVANKWQSGVDGRAAAELATEQAGW
jgi:3-oxoacyl-[acyl-carrier protein] reductase